jgi:hypothetical protein
MEMGERRGLLRLAVFARNLRLQFFQVRQRSLTKLPQRGQIVRAPSGLEMPRLPTTRGRNLLAMRSYLDRFLQVQMASVP